MRADDPMRFIIHAPREIGESLARQGSSVGERRDILTDLLWLGLVLLELDPFGLSGEFA